MSKEYIAYRYLLMIYVVLVANVAVLIATGFSYYLWFFSSILVLIIFSIIERGKIINLLGSIRDYQISKNCIYLIPFLITYPRHYQLSREVDYIFVALFQLLNVVLFFLVYGIEKKTELRE